MDTKVLDVNRLSISIKRDGNRINVVDEVSFNVGEGESVGIVGESGCGKSITALSIMGLAKAPLMIEAEEILFNQVHDLSGFSTKEYKKIRALELSMIFQEPMTALNPVMKVGKQIGEVLKIHTRLSKKERQAEVIRLIQDVGIPRPDEVANSYPHQLSGGMRQRIMIAIAIACSPKLLIADEPTTALDVTIQAQILDLIKRIQEDRKMALMLITHDLGVVKESCERVIVMYAGRIVETGLVDEILFEPYHPYTKGLIASLPKPKANGERLPYIKGNVPQPQNWAKGCRFADRCPNAMEKCFVDVPVLKQTGTNRKVACWLYESEAGLNGNID